MVLHTLGTAAAVPFGGGFLYELDDQHYAAASCQPLVAHPRFDCHALSSNGRSIR